ncbi:DUF2922 family protein [Melghiribacillus thermohalophilus]|uniref:DUF2922 family protein n=1 Tax=Melghiribacillus thermohalophilus TaxID=1324956 RepID=A0A4R3MQB6_9BACI|nr:DUF2922 domain-containing protein [Melghiribacillus thermohalophilus]TCT18073.1 DUF2922 family protein [Melghiribacillus thermohalophilus]
MSKRLELKFLNEENKTVTIALDQPVEPADPQLINQAMDEIISQNIFTTSGGDLVEKKGARIVERNVYEIML